MMSLLNLLSLKDDEIDIATTVVREWCAAHQIAIDSQRGRSAMSETVRLLLAGEKSPVILAESLSRHMRLEQFRNPRD